MWSYISSILAVPMVYLAYILLGYYRRVSACRRALQQFQTEPCHWFWGHDFPGYTQKGLEYIVQRTVTHPYMSTLYMDPLWKPVLLLTHPEPIKKLIQGGNEFSTVSGPGGHALLKHWLGGGLLTSTGRQWARHHRLLSPGFNLSMLQTYLVAINDCCQSLFEQIEPPGKRRKSKQKNGLRHRKNKKPELKKGDVQSEGHFAKTDGDNSTENNSSNDKNEIRDDCPKSLEIYSLLKLCSLHIMLRCACSVGQNIRDTVHATCPYVKAIQSILRCLSARQLNPIVFPDALYWRTDEGKMFHLYSVHAHEMARHVIEKRRREGAGKQNGGALDQITADIQVPEKNTDTLTKDVVDNGSGNGQAKHELKSSSPQTMQNGNSNGRYKGTHTTHEESRSTQNGRDTTGYNKTTEKDLWEEVERKKSEKKYRDYLDLLISATDVDGDKLTDKEIQDELATFLYTGYETTASALTWLLYNLARYPEHQTRAYQEVTAIFADQGSKVNDDTGSEVNDTEAKVKYSETTIDDTGSKLNGEESKVNVPGSLVNDSGSKVNVKWDDLSQMTFLTKCIKESLRMHPPITLISREISRATSLEVDLPEKKETIDLPEGLRIGVHIYGLHHNAKVWGEDHNEFKPDRFSYRNVRDLKPNAFLPFSVGHKNCLGEQFAMSIIKTVTTQLLLRYDVTLDSSHAVEMVPDLVLRPKDGIKLYFTRRETSKL